MTPLQSLKAGRTLQILLCEKSQLLVPGFNLYPSLTHRNAPSAIRAKPNAKTAAWDVFCRLAKHVEATAASVLVGR